MLSVNAFVLASVAVSFANSIAIAGLFGLTRAVDAYYAALLLPTLFMYLCVDYLGKNFLPVLARASAQSAATAAEVTSSVVTIVALLAAGVALVLALAAKPIFTLLLPGFDAAAVEVVTHYFWIMAPAIVFSAVTPFHGYVCQHDEQYAAVAAIWAAPPLVNLATILGAGPIVGAYALPIGYTAGQAVTFLLMTRLAKYRYRPRLTIRPQWERRIFTNSAIVMSSGLLVRTRSLISSFLASLVGEGALAALNFGYKLVEPLERTTFSGVRMLMFSRTARLVVEDNSHELARLYRLGLAASFLLLAPVLWWLALESELIVTLVFERGAFDAGMTALVAVAIIGFAPSVMFAGVNTLLSNAFYAMDRVAVPALVTPIGTLVYLAIAPAIYQPLGVLGLALGSSAAHATVFVILLYLLAKRVPGLGMGAVLLRIAGFTLLGGAALMLPQLVLERIQLHELAAAAGRLGAGLLIYFGVLMLVRERTFVEVVSYFRRVHPRLAARRSAS
jgi:putative peptidoglycan lipid II flippase